MGRDGGGIPLCECLLMTAHRVENVAMGDVKTLINKGSHSISCTLKAAIMSKQCFTGCDGRGIFQLRARGVGGRPPVCLTGLLYAGGAEVEITVPLCGDVTA